MGRDEDDLGIFVYLGYFSVLLGQDKFRIPTLLHSFPALIYFVPLVNPNRRSFRCCILAKSETEIGFKGSVSRALLWPHLVAE